MNNISHLSLKLHTKKAHKQRNIKKKRKYCREIFLTDCDFSSTSKIRLEDHHRIDHEGLSYDCLKCDFKGTSEKKLREHGEYNHEGIVHQCDQCKFKGK